MHLRSRWIISASPKTWKSVHEARTAFSTGKVINRRCNVRRTENSKSCREAGVHVETRANCPTERETFTELSAPELDVNLCNDHQPQSQTAQQVERATPYSCCQKVHGPAYALPNRPWPRGRSITHCSGAKLRRSAATVTRSHNGARAARGVMLAISPVMMTTVPSCSFTRLP